MVLTNIHCVFFGLCVRLLMHICDQKAGEESGNEARNSLHYGTSKYALGQPVFLLACVSHE